MRKKRRLQQILRKMKLLQVSVVAELILEKLHLVVTLCRSLTEAVSCEVWN